jgi:p-aminobenzoyl-glutamate transporter AbgT
VSALFVYLLALGCWLGAMVFFSFIIAPIIFTRLPIAEAGKVVAGIFPRYYALDSVLGIIALVLAVYFATTRGARGWWSGAAAALVIALALTLYAGFVVRPRIDAIRTVAEAEHPDPAQKAEFDNLHRLSVILNGAVMLLNVAALAASAGALTPRG